MPMLPISLGSLYESHRGFRDLCNSSVLLCCTSVELSDHLMLSISYSCLIIVVVAMIYVVFNYLESSRLRVRFRATKFV